MRNILVLLFLVFLSISINCQNVNYIELLDCIPIRIRITNSLINEYLNGDAILDQYKEKKYFTCRIDYKFINTKNDIISLIIWESQSVGNRGYLISYSVEGKIIDEKKIMDAFDNDDLSAPDFDYTYTVNKKQIKIKYRKSNPIADDPHKMAHTDSVYYSYININNSGYFFELSNEDYSNKERQFPEASEKLLAKYELTNLTIDDLAIMRNEIFASKGYIFKTNRYKSYFAEQVWYKPQFNNVDNNLSNIEKENIKLIKALEK